MNQVIKRVRQSLSRQISMQYSIGVASNSSRRSFCAQATQPAEVEEDADDEVAVLPRLKIFSN